MDSDLVRGLRSRGLDVLTAVDAGMIRRSDEDHLSLAAGQSRALYSFNVADYHQIHTNWVVAGRTHSGVILSRQKRYSTGEQIRRLVHLIGSISAESMANRAEFLSRW